MEPAYDQGGGAELAADLAACGRIIRAGSKSFHAASLLLPRDVRAAAYALYAFCREADDAVDCGADPIAALAGVRSRLAGAYAGRPVAGSVDRAFAWVVKAYGIPLAIPEALIEGFEWDSAGRRYATISDVKAYAARVAGTVGVMMALVMGVRGRKALARACDLGMAMQLTNIARDIGEDARTGRCYLPVSWLEEAGLTVDAMSALDTADEPVRLLTARLLSEAGPLYERGISGIALLPASCRPAIRAAAAIYAEIGEEIAKAGHDTISQRAVVSTWRKLALAAGSVMPVASDPALLQAPADRASQFLLDAVAALGPVRPSHIEVLRPGTASWALDLFVRLEQRDLQAETG